MERGAARRVAGQQDHPRRAGTSSVAPSPNVETSAIRGIRSAPCVIENHRKLQQRSDLDRAETLGRVRDLATCQRGVELVDEDRRAALAPDPLGEPDVVGMAVGQHDRPDVLERAAHRRELGRKVAPVRGGAGVDDRDLAVRPRSGTSSDALAEPPDPGRDLHVSSFWRVGRRTG